MGACGRRDKKNNNEIVRYLVTDSVRHEKQWRSEDSCTVAAPGAMRRARPIGGNNMKFTTLYASKEVSTQFQFWRDEIGWRHLLDVSLCPRRILHRPSTKKDPLQAI